MFAVFSHLYLNSRSTIVFAATNPNNIKAFCDPDVQGSDFDSKQAPILPLLHHQKLVPLIKLANHFPHLEDV